MRKFGLFMASLAALALSACGGGSSSFSGGGTSSSGTTVANGAASISLVTSLPQIPSTGATTATITAVVKNANNVVVSNADVTFAATSGSIAPIVTTTGTSAGVTDASGEAAATLSTLGNPANRDITVTVSVGTVSAKIVVAVVGTNLTITGPTSLIQGASGTFSVALTDSAGTGIANTSVTLASAKSNTLSASSVVTDNTGHATFTMTGTNSGTDTVTATALGISAAQSVSVSSQSFNITSPGSGTDVNIGTSQAITLVWTNGGTAVANTAVTFSTTRGLFGSATSTSVNTDSTGTATVNISSTTAGPAVITATGSGVSTQLTINFVATTPSQIDVQASPATINTSGQSTITAIVRDANNNLVQGVTVDFQLQDQTGGQLSVGSATTDSTGRAQTVYTATTVASASNGVQITASIPTTSITNSTTLTVGGLALYVRMGTGNQISVPNTTQFEMPYVVQVSDSSGHAVVGATVTVTLRALPVPATTVVPAPSSPNYTTTQAGAAFAKGHWSCSGTAVCVQVINALCQNEDLAGNGILASGDDRNGNGVLDPGNVANVSPGSSTTDSTGSTQLTIIYPQDHSAWVQMELTATASSSGTEGTSSATFWLPMLATDVASGAIDPPGDVSPYGNDSSCADTN